MHAYIMTKPTKKQTKCLLCGKAIIKDEKVVRIIQSGCVIREGFICQCILHITKKYVQELIETKTPMAPLTENVEISTMTKEQYEEGYN